MKQKALIANQEFLFRKKTFCILIKNGFKEIPQ